MVYDCIPFFNEIDMLKLRLHILDPYVDRFVIEEATMTFSGEPKELFFQQNAYKFKAFAHKITHIVVDNTPVLAGTHERDYFQKNRLIEGLEGATEDDIILFGDCDEIPNPKVLQGIIKTFDKTKVYHLAQENCYAYMNMVETSGTLLSITGDFPEIPVRERKWLGTKITSTLNIPKEGIVRLRDLVPVTDLRSVRVENGGWHFGYMGGEHELNVAKRIGVKVKAAAHQEYNDEEVLRETLDHLILGRDMFGRDATFQQVEIDDSYPQYLRDNLEQYSHFILPEITGLRRLCARFDLSVGRTFRKAVRKLRRLSERRKEQTP
ncbi:MAG: glycosyl transferase GT17 family protein [Lachnospiraceae bacterium]|nr:glycosyl transferase GT17 family protein [Lachnospiraceae bacterium]